MDSYEQTLAGIKWVLNNCTSYKVAKDLGINNRTVNRYQNGESPIGNMSLETASKIFKYYLKERIQMNLESLETAIKDFNDWEKGARIYVDLRDGYFNTDVYHNDVQQDQSISPSNFMCVYSKGEREGHIRIGLKRREYITQYSRLILDGWEPDQAAYELAELYV